MDTHDSVYEVPHTHTHTHTCCCITLLGAHNGTGTTRRYNKNTKIKSKEITNNKNGPWLLCCTNLVFTPRHVKLVRCTYELCLYGGWRWYGFLLHTRKSMDIRKRVNRHITQANLVFIQWSAFNKSLCLTTSITCECSFNNQDALYLWPQQHSDDGWGLAAKTYATPCSLQAISILPVTTEKFFINTFSLSL